MPPAIVLGFLGVTAGTAAATIITTAYIGVIAGAVIGGVAAAVDGGNILEGAVKGAIIGGVAGGLIAAGGVALGVMGPAAAGGAGGVGTTSGFTSGSGLIGGAGLSSANIATASSLTPTVAPGIISGASPYLIPTAVAAVGGGAKALAEAKSKKEDLAYKRERDEAQMVDLSGLKRAKFLPTLTIKKFAEEPEFTKEPEFTEEPGFTAKFENKKGIIGGAQNAAATA